MKRKYGVHYKYREIAAGLFIVDQFTILECEDEVLSLDLLTSMVRQQLKTKLPRVHSVVIKNVAPLTSPLSL